MSGAPARGERLLLLPGALWLGLFTLAPLAIVAAISLVTRGRPLVFEFSVSAYDRLLDPRWLAPLLRSLGFAAATTALCLLPAVPLSCFIARRTPRWRGFLHALVLLPLWANTVALVSAWIVVLRTNGLTDRAAQALGFLGAEDTLGLLYTPGAVLVGLVSTYLPFMVYSVYVSVERFDWRLLDAAEDLGATRARAFVRVLLPGIRPGLVAGSVLVFVPALGAFVVPDLLGGARTSIAGNIVQDRFRNEPLDWPLGAAMAVAMMALVAVAMWVWFRHAVRPDGRSAAA